MKGGGIGIWCTVSSFEYDLLIYTLKNAIESNDVSRIVIVTTGPNKPNNLGFLSNTYAKVSEHYKNFGSGFDLSVKNGGYDQVSARNYAISKVESFSDVEWLFQYDADDFYDEKIFSFIKYLDDRYKYIVCSCYTLTSTDSYWFPSNKVRVLDGKKILDPHLRIWRKELFHVYQVCPSASKYFKNHTRHCGLDFGRESISQVTTYLANPFHFHLHFLLKKRHSSKMSVIKKIDFILPESLVLILKSSLVN